MSDSHKHWADHWLMKLTAFGVRVLGRRVLSPVLHGIVLYFFLFGRSARQSAWQYQQRLATWSGQDALLPTRMKVFRQFMAFADALLDKLDVWNGKLSIDQIKIIDPALNRLLGEAGATNLRLIQVSELDPAIMLQLSQRLDRGEWLAIAGDRVPLHGGRNVRVDFLGHAAAFPQGPWLLAGLLKCPVNLLFCLKLQGRYHVTLEPFTEAVQWKRGDREQVIAHWTARYAERLGQYCLQAPQQWFNFYPFWKTDDDASA